MRKCAYSKCQKPLVKRPTEGPTKFRRRKYCSASCYGLARKHGEAPQGAAIKGTMKKRRGQWSDCICPRCEGKHKSRIYWTGRGIPRIYCFNCSNVVADRDYVSAGVANKTKCILI